MKRFLGLITLFAIVSLALNPGGFDMTHDAMAAEGGHMADDVAGMHMAMVADGPSIDAPLPICGMDFLCYIACQGARTATLSEARIVAPSEKIAPADCESETTVVAKSQSLNDTIQTSFSPPDDPRSLLSILKRE